MDFSRKNVLICDTQPVAVEGMRWLIDQAEDLRFAGSVQTLDELLAVLDPDAARLEAELAAVSAVAAAAYVAPQMGAIAAEPIPEEFLSPEPELPEPALAEPIDAVVIDKAFGIAAVMEMLRTLTATSHPTPAVVWGAAITENEALRLLQAGARGVLRRTSESELLLTCLRAVIAGNTWMEDGIFGSAEKIYNPRRSELTSREREVAVLVEKGLRNRDIAQMLGIQTGTVKIHLKHIFEKTGVRGRYGLAFTGLHGKASPAVTAPPQFTA